MAYGRLQTEAGERLAALKGITLFKVGAKVTTHRGHEGQISDVTVYGCTDGDDGSLFWNMCTYTVSGTPFGPGGMRVDFVDAHYTLGGTLRAANASCRLLEGN